MADLGREGKHAVAGDRTRERTPTLHHRLPARSLYDDRAVCALQREPENRLQVDRSPGGGRTRRATRSEPRPAPLPAPHCRRRGGTDLRGAPGAPELGATPAAPVAGAPRTARGLARAEHGRGSPRAPRAG